MTAMTKPKLTVDGDDTSEQIRQTEEEKHAEDHEEDHDVALPPMDMRGSGYP